VQRRQQVDILARQGFAAVKSAGVPLCKRQARLAEHNNLISRVQFRERRLTFFRRVPRADPTADREVSFGHLHVDEFSLQRIAPGKLRWFISQDSVPAEWCSYGNLVRGEARKDVLRRQRLQR
jgi:hypothetical protein